MPHAPAGQSPFEIFDRALRSAGLLFILAAAAIGCAIGWFTGMSNSPVVATLLPLLLVAVGGAGGFYISRIRFDSLSAVWRLHCIALASVAFAVMSIAGALLGLSIRTGQLPWSAQPVSTPISLDLSNLSLVEAVEAVSLRNSLMLLGLPRSEQSALLQLAVESTSSKQADGSHAALGGAILSAHARTVLGWIRGQLEGNSNEEFAAILRTAEREFAACSAAYADASSKERSLAEVTALHRYGSTCLRNGVAICTSSGAVPIYDLMLTDEAARPAFFVLAGEALDGDYPSADSLSTAVAILESAVRLEASIPRAAVTAGRGLASGDPPRVDSPRVRE